MKKAAILMILMMIAAIGSIYVMLSSKPVMASDNYAITSVDSAISLTYNSYVLMNNTIKITGEMPDSFLLGFPISFGAYIVDYRAYDVSNHSKTFMVSAGEPLEDRSGFYGLKVSFLGVVSQSFSVETLFSNRLVTQDSQNSSLFAVVFPGFPGLTKMAENCNTSIILPQDAQYAGGNVSSLTYGLKNMTAFNYNVTYVTFGLAAEQILLYDVNQMDRELRISEYGGLTGSDSYYITNLSPNAISVVDVFLPSNATGVSAEDQFGRTLGQPFAALPNSDRYSINFTEPVAAGKSSRFTVVYSLPKEVYIEQDAAGNFDLDMTLFEDTDCYINETALTFVLPEGANLHHFEETLADGSFDVSRSVFQETIGVSAQGMFASRSFDVRITYDYNPLWLAFRPTTWVLAITAIGCVAFVVVKRLRISAPTALPTPISRISPEYIRSFVGSYQEKMKIVSEIDSLESKARKGRIPRRQYKVQTRTLETRLDTLSRNLAGLGEKMRSSGSHYASLMRELEIAETEMTEADANIKSIEARHERGEISLETYRIKLSDHQRRKEKAETVIEGILLRLREEVR